MSEGEQVNGVISRNVPVERQIAGIPKLDHEFTKLRLFCEGTPDFRIGLQEKQAPSDRFARSRSHASILGNKEAAASADAARAALGNDYSWQSGISASASAPQLRSHF